MSGELKAMVPEDVTRLVVELLNGGDAAGVAEPYERDAVFAYPADRPTSGREAIQAIYQRMIDAGVKFGSETPLPTIVFGDLALTSTRSADKTGVRVQVLRRQPDGSWLRIIDRPEVPPAEGESGSPSGTGPKTLLIERSCSQTPHIRSRVRSMSNHMTLRNILAIGLLLVGASWLWLTPMWLSQGRTNASIFDPRGLLSVLAIVAFAVVAWGVFRSASWWEPLAIASALVGIAAAFVFWFWAAPSASSQTDIATNALVHIAAGALLVAVLLIKPAEQWLAGHL